MRIPAIFIVVLWDFSECALGRSAERSEMYEDGLERGAGQSISKMLRSGTEREADFFAALQL